MNKRKPAFDPAFITSLKVGDIDEVSYLSLYSPQVSAAPVSNHQPHTAASKPLIDVVTPQPKAFFAYLRMPKSEPVAKKAKTTTKRIRRTRKSGKA